MITVTDLAESLGTGLLRVVAAGRETDIHDIVLAEPGDTTGQPGELVLGIGLTDRKAAVTLLERAAAAGAAGVVMKTPLAGDPEVTRTARRLGAALVELQPHASWAHLVWLLRGVIDRALVPDTAVPGVWGVHNDLFALADAAAKIVDAPVTIEDAQSRVLAYSTRQDATDPARVSTIVGRRVPPHVLTHYRAAGVFRRLARSGDPVLAPAGPDGTLPRLVVPVRAGGEWLGSIWVVARQPVPGDRIRELTDIASVLALHMLRLRAEADITRRVTAGALRTALRGGAQDPAGGLPSDSAPALPGGPWRVVRLMASGETADVRLHLEVWESIVRRFGWHQPLLTDLDGLLFGVVTEALPGGRRAAAGDGPGSMAWLRHMLAQMRAHDPSLRAAAGGLAHSPAELPRSRAEATELARLIAAGRLTPESLEAGTVTLEEAWDAIVIERARGAIGAESGLPGSPITALRDHDRAHSTAYLATLTAWLDHYGDPQRAAQTLRVHPNTLRYRLRKLDDVAPVDLSSPRVRLALRLQLAALE